MKVCWSICLSFVLVATDGKTLGSSKWPLNLQLTPKASGMAGLPSIYAVDMTVGRDGPLAMLVDTGSPALVVQSDLGGDTASSTFLASDSSSTIEYGGSTVRGDIVSTRVCFNDKIVLHQEQADDLPKMERSSKRTCVKDFPLFDLQKGDSGFSQLGLDGVLGLGPASGGANLGLTGLDETLLDGLAKTGSAQRIFGLFFSPGPLFGDSVLSLGGYDSSKILRGAELEYVPLAQPVTGRWEIALQSLKLVAADGSSQEVDACQGRTDCRVLLDSGTAQIAAVPQFTDTLSSTVRNANSGDCMELQAMPDIHIEFAAGAVFSLGPEDYVLDTKMCSLAVDEMTSKELSREKSVTLILGQPFLRKVYTVFDQDQQRVGMAPSIAANPNTQNDRQRASSKQERMEEKRLSVLNYLNGDNLDAVKLS